MHEDIKKEYEDLNTRLGDPGIISEPKKLADLGRRQSELKVAYDLILELEKVNNNIEQNNQIMGEENDSELKAIAEEELADLGSQKEELESELANELKPKDPRDKKNCIIEIRAGTGGDESALFATDLFRMYSKHAESKNWKLSILTSNSNEIGGFKEVIFEIVGNGAYGEFKFESGIHRVQRVPETEKQGRIHTSAATVAVLAEAEVIDLEIRNEDIRIDTFCSSGPGGQSVNTTHSAIRITHTPSGLIVSCQDQKSQHQNKDKAMQILRSRLLNLEEEKRRQEESDERLSQIGTGDRSEKIRTYNFPQDRITDHRINKNWHGITKILDGGVGMIIEDLKSEM